MLGPAQLERVRFPVGSLTKAEVREHAARLGLRTAAKPDSQDVCFVASSVGRRGFLERRTTLHPARVVDRDGAELARVDAVELVTVGQRRGLGAVGGDGEPRFVLDVDVAARTVTVGSADDLLVDHTPVAAVAWTDGAGAPRTPVLVQCSAHGEPEPATVEGDLVRWFEPHRRVAPGQTVAFYDGDVVIGSALATIAAPAPR